MTWEIFLGIAALLAFVLVFMKASRDLTGSVTELACAIKALKEQFTESQKTTTKRLDAHGNRLDYHETRIIKNEDDIKNIKEKVDYFHHK